MRAARDRSVNVLLAALLALVGAACGSSTPQEPGDATTPAGAIPCGSTPCDSVSQYCAHFVDGLNAGARSCQPLPASCAGGAADCACLPDGGAPFCFSCRVVSGSSASGLELDCPGPID